MKLLLCSHCYDVIRLDMGIEKFCTCRLCKGRYVDDLNAEYSGPAIPIGFSNPSLIHALQNQPQSGNGKEFTAFVIPKECPTFKKMD